MLFKKRYWVIQNNYDHYVCAHNGENLARLRMEIQKRCSDYLVAFDAQVKSRSVHMFIMQSELLDILLSLKEKIDVTERSV